MMIRSRSRRLTATADRKRSLPMFASTVTDLDTSVNPAGTGKQYGAPLGAITVPPAQLSESLVGRPDGEADAVPDEDSPGCGLWEGLAGVGTPSARLPLPVTVVVHPAASTRHNPPRTRAGDVRRIGAR